MCFTTCLNRWLGKIPRGRVGVSQDDMWGFSVDDGEEDEETLEKPGQHSWGVVEDRKQAVGEEHNAEWTVKGYQWVGV